jgi:hypothetical protein
VKYLSGMGGEAGVDLDQVHLPDPVEQQIEALLRRVEALERVDGHNAGDSGRPVN